MRFQPLLFLVCLLAFTGAYAGNGVSIKTIVIDAGHGGKDPGATGPGKTNEKDVALSVALKLGDYIHKNYASINIIYTRQTDKFLELHERAEIANKNKADLFIAVHCNSSTSATIYGTSTYVLGLHRTEANLDVAKRENSVILMEGDRDKNYEFDPNTPEGNIIMSMKQNAFLDQSIDIASKIESQYETVGRRKSLGVKQAGFYVLYKTTMPSLLSEIGFLSNPDEEKFLASAKGQDQIASSLYKAFKEYKYEMENRQGEPVADNDIKKQSGNPVEDTKSLKSGVTGEKETVDVKAVPTDRSEDPSVVTTISGRKIRKPLENSSGGGVSPNKPVVKPAPAPTPAPAAKAEAQPKAVAESKPTSKPVDTVATAKTIKVEPDKKKPQDLALENKPLATPKETKSTNKTNVVAPKPKEPEIVSDEVSDSSAVPEINVVKKEVVKKPAPETKVIVEKPAPTPKTEPEVIATKHTIEKSFEAKPAPKTETKTTTTKTTVKVETEKPAVAPKETKAVAAKPGIHNMVTETGTVFKVQLYALKIPLKTSEREKALKIFSSISTQSLPNGITRYYVGDVKSYAEAKKIQKTAVGQGYLDAFVVGFKNGERLTSTEMKAFEK